MKEEKVFATSGKKKASVREETSVVSGMRGTRKLDVQFISRSDKHGETRRVVFKQKQVESKNVFW